ncbi:hypothetical protein V6N12_042258 [Hibiscus sabdariffa]|uniref:Uncharacterized protein n=1 Tax=Hibiscus sabdariffa TaxID=183260 RepID=A0ABR2EE89_9ROSI
MIIVLKCPLPEGKEGLKVNELVEDMEASKGKKTSKRCKVTFTKYDVLEYDDGSAIASDVIELRADIFCLKSLEEKVNKIEGGCEYFKAMQDEMTCSLQKISRKIEDDGVNLVNEINRSLYATEGDPPSTLFKTPKGRAKTINLSNCLTPRKDKLVVVKVSRKSLRLSKG